MTDHRIGERQYDRHVVHQLVWLTHAFEPYQQEKTAMTMAWLDFISSLNKEQMRDYVRWLFENLSRHPDGPAVMADMVRILEGHHTN